MDILETIKLALEAIKINKLRSILTALGIIIGVASIVLLISIGTGLSNYVSGQFAKLGANAIFILPGRVRVGPQGGPPRSINKITFDIAERLDREKGPYITEISPLIQLNVTASYKGQSKITTLAGTKSTYFTSSGITAAAGRVYSDRDDAASRKVVVIGKTLGADLFKGDTPVGKTILLSKKPFSVIGVLEPQGNAGGVDIDNQALMPLSTARKLTGTNQVNSILVRTVSTKEMALAKAQVEKVLKRTLTEDDFTILTQEQLLSSILSILSVLTMALGGIAAISLVVGGVGISNIMLVSVTERTREIGLRKAVGARPRDILGQFLVEAVILSVFGGVIGITTGYLGSLALSNFLKTAVPLWAVLLGIGFSSTVGIIFGVAPAIRASRLEPIVALKHE